MVTSAAVAGVALTTGPAEAQTASDVLYRVNGGSGPVTDSDAGPDWTPPGSTSGVSVSGGTVYDSYSGTVSFDSSVPAGTPTEIFASELYGDQQWEFSDNIQSGQEYEVRLYFAEIFHGVSNSNGEGARVFDVAIEGQTVLNDYDIYADVGAETGVVKSFTTTPTDGTIDVDFTTVVDNAKISAIEIVPAEAEPDVLGGPGSVDFGTVVTGDSGTETVTLTNLGDASNASHPDVTITDVSISGADAGEFGHDFSGDVTLAPGDSTDVQVTFAPSDAQAKSATLSVTHSGSNSPLTVDLTGEGASTVPVGFQSGSLQGFSAGSVTAVDFGPDGRLYASTQGGTVYALNVTRNGEASYAVDYQKQIDAIKQIPNHDDDGNYNPGETNRQITGLTVGGTASQPIVYVSSSDPTIDVGTDDDDTDTNSGAISRLTLDWGGDGQLADSEIDHDVMVLGLPRSEENHATNGIDLSNDGDTLYVAQGGHTNKGAPGDNFGHTPEYALSGATLEIDLALIENDYAAKNLQNYDAQGSSQSYPDLTFLYAIPTVQNDDATDGDDLPFGGDDGLNQAKLVPGGPVGIWSPGYRNPYDLTVTEGGLVYVTDNGPNGGWGGEPADANGDTTENAADVTNHPNEDDSYTTSDQVHLATEGHYAGHAAPIRANPDGAGLYFENGTLRYDFNASDSPVPFSMADPRQADYVPPESEAQGPDIDDSHDGSLDAGFSPLGGIVEYPASNFGGAMQGDLLAVEFFGSTSRLELNSAGDGITNREDNFLTASNQMLGITAQDDDEVFPGTVWTSWGGIAVFEPNDYGDTAGEPCTGADDPSLDEDGDGYDNADEIDAGTDPCSSASTPPDFDGDDTSNLNDPDDDDDGAVDSVDPFAVDAANGTTTDLPVDRQLQPNSYPNTILGLGFTGLMTNGVDDYQDLYDPTQLTAGGAANVLTVENVPPGDAHQSTNTQQYAFQYGVNAPAEPFTVHTTVSGYPETPENFQSMGLFVGNGDQDNYLKLVVAADGGNGGIEFAKEVDGTFTHPGPNIVSDSAVTGPANSTDLSLTVFPSNETVHAYYTPQGGQQQFVGAASIPPEWLDSSDGTGLAVGVISTSNGASSTFDATWTHLSAELLDPPAEPVVADAGADQTVDEGDAVTLDASGSSGDDLTYSWAQIDTGAPLVTIQDADTATPTFTAPEVDADETLTFQVEVSNGTAIDTDTVDVTVQDTDVAAGEVVFAENAGGSQYTATDGTVYQADTNFDGGSTYSTTEPIGETEDDTLYQTERYGQDFGYDVPLENGTYQVTLQFAEIYQGVAATDSPDSTGPTDGTNENDRVFDVTLEGQGVIENLDLYATVGPLNATTQTYTVEVTDGELNVGFPWDGDNYDNAKISAFTVTNVTEEPGDMTVAEAVASQNAPEDLIGLQEIQLAINWWATGQEVPDTGGETLSLQDIQQLINTWATGGTVGDGPTAAFTVSPSSPTVGEEVTFDGTGSTGDSLSYAYEIDGVHDHAWHTATITHTFDTPGDHEVTLTVTDASGATDQVTETVTVSSPLEGSALVEVTPDAGLEATTYGQGSYQVTNTGEGNITSVSFDLSSAQLPDMVFDPQGTAGDPTGEGLNIVDEGGTGITTAEGGSEAFSQPHNGVDGDDGYDVMTVEFDDFQSGETATFWADNDPTSIKGATVGSQEAGPVSGLELAGSTITVTYEDGSTHTTQLMGDGSDGGSTATVDDSESAAPTIGAEGVTLDGSVLDARHSAATVTDASQTITVTGQPGETVTLLRTEGELTLTNVPDADGDGEPGYEIEAYEANDAEDVEYYTATLDAAGEAQIPVTLTNTTSDGDNNAGYNYFVAVQGDPSADAGLVSNVVVLELVEGTGDGGDQAGDVVYRVNAGGPTVADSPTDWSADTSGSPSQYLAAGGATAGGYSPSTIDSSVPSGTPTTLFETERYDPEGDSEMQWDFPTPSGGEYEVRLYVCDCYSGTSAVGDRVFNVSIEGQQVLSNFDPIAAYGDDTAAMESFAITSDGTIDLDFEHVTENPTVNAIEIVNVSDGDGSTNQAPSIDPISDQTVTEGETAQVGVSASDADGDSLSLSVSGPGFVSITDAGDGTGTIDIAPGSGDAGTYTVDVVADDGTTTTTESFQLTVEAPPSGPGSADLSVTAGGGIGASTFSGGSFEVTNTGDQAITSVTFDLSESLIPDAVFDPDGTAGDASAKGLSVDGQSGGDGDVGVVSTADGDVFAQPHNGVDGADGYDAMTIAFDDFDSGETVTFSTDVDPTTIKGASTTGGAGSVSGLELAGSGVTVEYGDGSSQTTDLAGDGSDGGAQATATDSVPGAPTLGVVDVTLESTDFPGHEAATVGNDSQTLTLDGPAGATVQLVHVEASGPPSDGYDLDAYEADAAEVVSHQSVALDASGQATVPVTLAESNLNYFVATVEDAGGDTGQASNTVILDYNASAGEPQVLHRVNAGESATLSALDDGPDWTGVEDTSSPYLVSVASTSAGTYCGGDDVTPTSSVPSTTPEGVFDCERYGEMTWAFDAASGTEVEVRLYLSNQFPGASEPGDRQFNVSIEGQQVLTQYDPVADVGHANGTMQAFTVTSDGTVDVVFELGSVENPQVNAIEIVANPDGGSS